MGMTAEHVIWHDVECGSYEADLPLWRELAEACGGPVLDLGAGTGRVALDLAGRGHEVHALDVDPLIVEALRGRAGDLPVTVHLADARSFDLGRRFPLVLAPMQTTQLLGGRQARAGMLTRCLRHLEPGGLLAAALAAEVVAFDDEDAVPVPDLRELHGIVYASRPVAIREEDDAFVLERLRERVATDGSREVSADVVRLDRLTPDELEDEGRAAGFAVEPRRHVARTDDHVGSEVVVLRA
jgi:SAM-dependent methyltransferase